MAQESPGTAGVPAAIPSSISTNGARQTDASGDGCYWYPCRLTTTRGRTTGAAAIPTVAARAFPPEIAPRRAARPLDATVVVPGSKSITNRALVVAALADGPSELLRRPRQRRYPLHGGGVECAGRAGGERRIECAVPRGRRRRHVSRGGGRPLRRQLGHDHALPHRRAAAGAGALRIDGVPRMRQRPIAPLIDGPQRPRRGRVQRAGHRLPTRYRGGGGIAGRHGRAWRAISPLSTSAPCSWPRRTRGKGSDWRSPAISSPNRTCR